MAKRRKEAQEIATSAGPIAVLEQAHVTGLKAKLEEIENYDGVVGYILRNTTSATVDLKDPTKIIDYASLSSSSIETANEFSELFALSDVKDIVIDGKRINVLSLTIDENKISIFMEKNADREKILKKLRAP